MLQLVQTNPSDQKPAFTRIARLPFKPEEFPDVKRHPNSA